MVEHSRGWKGNGEYIEMYSASVGKHDMWLIARKAYTSFDTHLSQLPRLNKSILFTRCDYSSPRPKPSLFPSGQSRTTTIFHLVHQPYHNQPTIPEPTNHKEVHSRSCPWARLIYQVYTLQRLHTLPTSRAFPSHRTPQRRTARVITLQGLSKVVDSHR